MDQTHSPSKEYEPAEYRSAVGVIIEKRKLTNPWVDHVWLPAAILPGVPEAEPWTVLFESDALTQVYAGAHELTLYSADTENYRINLETGEPKIWVALREASGPYAIEVSGVTVDPAEGEAFTEAGGDTVEAVPMPREIIGWVEAFIAEHHVERKFFKRQRDQFGSETLARRPPSVQPKGFDDDG